MAHVNVNEPRPQSPLFAKTYDLLLWLIPLALKFPKAQRFLLAERLCNMALDFYDLILDAVIESESGDRPDELIRQADRQLTKIRLYVRLSYDLACMSMGQWEQTGKRVDEVGRLLGGWQRKRAQERVARTPKH